MDDTIEPELAGESNNKRPHGLHNAPNYGPYRTILGKAHRCLTCAFAKQICSGLLGIAHKCTHTGHIEKVAHNYGCDDWQPKPHTGGRAKYKKTADWIFRKS